MQASTHRERLEAQRFNILDRIKEAGSMASLDVPEVWCGCGSASTRNESVCSETGRALMKMFSSPATGELKVWVSPREAE